MEPFETFQYYGLTVELHYDEHAENPYTNHDQLSSLLIGPSLYREYDFGGREFSRMEEFESLAHATRYLTLMDKQLVAIPFVFQDYGSGGQRSYLVDSSYDRAAGFVVVSAEDARREAPDSTNRRRMREWAEKLARAEFEQFRAYVEQDVCGYVVKDDRGAILDSCWGFYGETDYCREEAKSATECEAHELWVNEEPRDIAEVLR